MGSRGLWARRENPGSLCLISVSSASAACRCQMSLFQCHEPAPQPRARGASCHTHAPALQPSAEQSGRRAAVYSSRWVKTMKPGRGDSNRSAGQTDRRSLQPSDAISTAPAVACVASTCPSVHTYSHRTTACHAFINETGRLRVNRTGVCGFVPRIMW